MKLKNLREGIPDGWRYTHEETGWISRAGDYWGLVENVNTHRRNNKLRPVSEDEIQNQICQWCPPGWCDHSEMPSQKVNARLTWSEIAAGTVAYAKLALGITKVVEPEEADRRAKICSGCFFRVTPQGCGSCSKMADLITGELVTRRTRYDDNLQKRACAVCKCPLPSLVQFPLNELDKADDSEKQAAYPDFCWRKFGSINRT